MNRWTGVHRSISIPKGAELKRGEPLTIAVPTNGGFSVPLCPATAGATSCGQAKIGTTSR
jgi:hypothetical protein